MGDKKLLFCFSWLYRRHPQWPSLLEAAKIMVRDAGIEGHVLVAEEKRGAWKPRGLHTADDFSEDVAPLKLHTLPMRKANLCSFGFERGRLKALLDELAPDYIWLHAEFWEGLVRQFLWRYRFDREVRIAAYVAINNVQGKTPLISGRWPFVSRTRLAQLLLWPRLDAVSACATKSMECARGMGLSARIPVVVNHLPVLGGEDGSGEPISLPWKKEGAFTVGFAGSIDEQKGWNVLLDAVAKLPEEFKVVLVGDGWQRDDLKARLDNSALKDRAHYAGLLSKKRLVASYPRFDVVVLPSLTTKDSVEQFGAVLAEAMACGVPVIGSDSGAIPETVGEAGLIVPEGDAEALAAAIVRMRNDESLRQRCIQAGLRQYKTQYSCAAYARSVAKLLQLAPETVSAEENVAALPQN